GTGDLSAILPGQSPCGRTNVRIRGWMGRADQTTKVKGMFVQPSQVAEIARRHKEILKARLVVDNPGGTDRMTLQCEVRGAPPAGVAVLFPGGEGLLGLRVEGGAVKFRQQGNFLVRTRTLMRDRQVGVAIVDSPSDQQRAGMDDGFRTGRAHVADVAAVVKDLKQRFPGAKIFLIGTSRGTISAA